MYEYLEVNLIGVFLLFIMYMYVRRNNVYGENGEQHYFQLLLFANALILLLDNGIYLLRGHPERALIMLTHAVCCLYFILHAWFCYFWMQFVITKLYPRHRQTVPERIFFLLPSIVNTVVVLLSPATGWIYTISAENRYHRGPFMWITFAIAIILHALIHPTMSREPGTYVSLLLFPLPSILGNLLQLRFYGLSIVWICMAMTLLVLFVDIQNELLSRDKLTGLFNRRQTNTQLEWEVQHLRQSHDFLFVAMIDVDHFKLINDKYGLE